MKTVWLYEKDFECTLGCPPEREYCPHLLAFNMNYRAKRLSIKTLMETRRRGLRISRDAWLRFGIKPETVASIEEMELRCKQRSFEKLRKEARRWTNLTARQMASYEEAKQMLAAFTSKVLRPRKMAFEEAVKADNARLSRVQTPVFRAVDVYITRAIRAEKLKGKCKRTR